MASVSLTSSAYCCNPTTCGLLQDKKILFHQIKKFAKVKQKKGLVIDIYNFFLPDRICLLLKGCVVLLKNCKSIDEDLETAFKNGKVFYLSPNSVISRTEKKTIELKQLDWKDSNGTKMKTNVDEIDRLDLWPYTENKNISVLSMTFILDTEAHAEAWEKRLNEEKNLPHLSESFVRNYDKDMVFNNKWYIWQMILGGNESVRSFYFNLTDVGRNNPEKNDVLFERLVDLVQSLCGNSIREGKDFAIAYLLYRISKDAIDRLMIMLCRFNPETVREITNYAAAFNRNNVSRQLKSNTSTPDWIRKNENLKDFWRSKAGIAFPELG